MKYETFLGILFAIILGTLLCIMFINRYIYSYYDKIKLFNEQISETNAHVLIEDNNISKLASACLDLEKKQIEMQYQLDVESEMIRQK